MPLAGALALATLVTTILLVGGVVAASAVDHAFESRLGDARSFQLRLVTLVLFLLLACVAGVLVDLARAAIARESGINLSSGETRPAWTVLARSLRVAFRTSRSRLRHALLAWAWRAALGVGLIALGYVAAHVLGGRGGGALAALFVIHQLVVLGRVALRASWLARAVAFVTPVQDSPEGGVPPASVSAP
jgi:hypothetical protein